MATAHSARRRRVIRATLVSIGLYTLVLLVAPAFHHDLACHLKSPTHCTTCLVSITAPGSHGAAGLVAADPLDAGVLLLDVVGLPARLALAPRVGRSPPA
ncbi:MAG TPA: hypothetical protein VHI98_14085 [Vicinamibacterales bacterium]|jgi:hypothetical protein|nr:hypothetical protein [Vicinamibacterales bacterium]